MRFRLVLCLPDGGVTDDAWWDIDPGPEQLFGPYVTVDAQSRKKVVRTAIGDLEFEWTGARELGLGSATVWRRRVVAMTMIYLFGTSADALEIARFTVQGWEDAGLVRELTNSSAVFSPFLHLSDRPFGLAVNWATIPKEELDRLGNPAVEIGAAFFRLMASPASRTPASKLPSLLKKLFGSR